MTRGSYLKLTVRRRANKQIISDEIELFILSQGSALGNLRRDQSTGLKILYDPSHRAFHIHLVCTNMNLRSLRSLIRRRYPGKICSQYLTLSCFLLLPRLDTPLISPALAFLYRPFGSRSSTTPSGASTKTSMKGMGGECDSCRCLARVRSAM